MPSLKKLAILPEGTMAVRDARGDIVTDETTGAEWSITVHSPGTKEFQKAKHTFDAKRSDSTLALMSGKGDTKREAEEEQKHVAEFLASVTKSFNGFDYEGRHGYEAYKAAYLDLEIAHVASDLNKYLGNRGNFLPPKATPSSNTFGTQPG